MYKKSLIKLTTLFSISITMGCVEETRIVSPITNRLSHNETAESLNKEIFNGPKKPAADYKYYLIFRRIHPDIVKMFKKKVEKENNIDYIIYTNIVPEPTDADYQIRKQDLEKYKKDIEEILKTENKENIKNFLRNNYKIISNLLEEDNDDDDNDDKKIGKKTKHAKTEEIIRQNNHEKIKEVLTEYSEKIGTTLADENSMLQLMVQKTANDFNQQYLRVAGDKDWTTIVSTADTVDYQFKEDDKLKKISIAESIKRMRLLKIDVNGNVVSDTIKNFQDNAAAE